jgi:hypothetical protein
MHMLAGLSCILEADYPLNMAKRFDSDAGTLKIRPHRRPDQTSASLYSYSYIHPFVHYSPYRTGDRFLIASCHSHPAMAQGCRPTNPTRTRVSPGLSLNNTSKDYPQTHQIPEYHYHHHLHPTTLGIILSNPSFPRRTSKGQ